MIVTLTPVWFFDFRSSGSSGRLLGSCNSSTLAGGTREDFWVVNCSVKTTGSASVARRDEPSRNDPSNLGVIVLHLSSTLPACWALSSDFHTTGNISYLDCLSHLRCSVKHDFPVILQGCRTYAIKIVFCRRPERGIENPQDRFISAWNDSFGIQQH